jgi:RNA polymerase sigma-70 factor (TIGR02957 family)
MESHEELRRLMFSIAYRMLGSVSEAEDVVQEAFLRLERARSKGTEVTSPRAFLGTVSTRLAIDHLRSARARRETYFGPWLPEPLVTAAEPDPADAAEMADSLSLSFLVLMETLSPVERAVFLLREVFGYGYDDIGGIVERTEANCRQIFARARKHIDEGSPRFHADARQQRELAGRFLAAFERGEIDGLVDLLAADVVFYGDGGGKAQGLPRPVYGSDRVARLLRAFSEQAAALDVRMVPTWVNGQPGTLNFDTHGGLINVLVLDCAGGVIQTVRSIINPDKLAHLGYPLSPVSNSRSPDRNERSR